MNAEEVRLDKWLWAVRIFRSRSAATEACNKAWIMLNDLPAKPSRIVRLNDVVKVRQSPIYRSFRVKGILANRVSAKIAAEYKEDITPDEELKKLEEARTAAMFYRQKGLGRPTKKDRRLLDDFGSYSFDENEDIEEDI